MLEDFQVAKNKLDGILNRYKELNELLSDNEIINNQNSFKLYSKELAQIDEISQDYQVFLTKLQEYNDAVELRNSETDQEMKALATEEITILKEDCELRKQDLKYRLIPQDPMASKNIIVEIRAGTGGDEGAFCRRTLPIQAVMPKLKIGA